MLNKFFLVFIPMFVAMGIVENVPIFILLTGDMSRKAKNGIVRQTVITATLIVVVFVFVGSQLLSFLGISMADFMVAGGSLLFVISIKILVEEEVVTRRSLVSAGVVPLGTPLIAGPAILAITLLLVNLYGVVLTLISFAICIALQGLAFYEADWIILVMGQNGIKAFAKVTAIFLAAIAVMLVRSGIIEIIQGTVPVGVV